MLTRAAYEALYGTSGSEFPDNTTALITEGKMRTFGQNTSESFWNKATDFQSLTTSTNVSNAYSVTGAITSYVTGFTIAVKFNAANTGPATLTVNGISAIAIKKNGTDALVSGDIAANQIYILQYDGTNFQLVGRHGASSSFAINRADVTLTAAEVRGLYTSPPTVISAPGVGRYIYPVAIYLQKIYAAPQLDFPSGNFGFTTGAGLIVTSSSPSYTLLNNTGTIQFLFHPDTATTFTDFDDRSNQPLKLAFTSGGAADATVGGTTIRVVVYYFIVDNAV
jgi:hypothetical protein